VTELVGVALARLYFAWGTFLVVGLVGVHAMVLACAAYRGRPASWNGDHGRRIIVAIEFAYGLVSGGRSRNPIPVPMTLVVRCKRLMKIRGWSNRSRRAPRRLTLAHEPPYRASVRKGG